MRSCLDKMNSNDTTDLLWQLNNERAMLFVPIIAFLALLAVVGTFGNIMVCYVYGIKKKKSSTDCFILALAILDLFSCLVGIPTEIVDLMFPYTLDALVARRLLRFAESTTIMGSIVVLEIVAFDRYYKICKLGKHYTLRKAKILCGVSIALGVLLSWPTLAISDQHVIGVDCSTNDDYHGTIFAMLYYVLLFVSFLVCFAILTGLYARIGLEVYRRRNRNISDHMPASPSTSFRFLSKIPNNNHPSDDMSVDLSSDAIEPDRININSSKNNKKKKRNKNEMNVRRTTMVLFAVSVAFVISFLPFLICMLLYEVIDGIEDTMDQTGLLVYTFALKIFFVNNAINPIIYSFLNINFRRGAAQALRRLCCGCRRS